METTRPRTMVVEGRVSATTMATVARYLEETGKPARTKSDLLWQMGEMLCQLLVVTGKVEPIEDIDSAYTYLTERFGTINRGGRGARSMQMALQVDAIMKDELAVEHLDKVTKPTVNAREKITEEELREVIRAEAAKLGIKPIDQPV
jgi:hypothetical protein